MIVERCEQCPLHQLDLARNNSEAGRLLNRALELDFAAESFSVPWSEVKHVDVKALQVLRQERETYKNERQRDEHERMLEENRIQRMREQQGVRGEHGGHGVQGVQGFKGRKLIR